MQTQCTPELRTEFEQLVRDWKSTRPLTSQSDRLAAHPAYQRIIALGERALPLILEELERSPDHWFQALEAITGDDPVPGDAQGSLRGAAAAWLDWGRERDSV